MILAALLLAQALPAPTAPPAAVEPPLAGAQDPAAGEASAAAAREERRRRMQQWWEGLSPEQQQAYRQRMEEFQRLGPEERDEMRRRREAVDRQRRKLWSEMPPEERERLGALEEGERGAELDRRVEERLRRRHEELRRRFGPEGPPEALRGRPLDERMEASRRLIQELRSSDLGAELERMHAEGWIGDGAYAWLQEASVSEQAAALLDVRKWRGLARIRQQGLARSWQLDEAQLRQLTEMPSRDFLVAVRELGSGVPREQVFAPRGPMGPPWAGDPGLWRGGERREPGRWPERGERGERGERPDRPDREGRERPGPGRGPGGDRPGPGRGPGGGGF